MEDIIVKSSEASAATVPLSETPPKQAHQPVERTIVGPFSSKPLPKETIAKRYFNAEPDIEAELAYIRGAWRRYRTTNSRDAVYIYLAAVFAVVRRWRRLNCALKNSRAALRLQADAPSMQREPFGIVIFCTCDPEVADAKMRSKWSRVLRYARKTKPVGQRLIDFIKSHGGLNECARRFARSR